MGWSDSQAQLFLQLQAVSIPERVWGGLERVLDRRMVAIDAVSIPERVWGGLERGLVFVESCHAPLFQSLRGFGVGWSMRLL